MLRLTVLTKTERKSVRAYETQRGHADFSEGKRSEGIEDQLASPCSEKTVCGVRPPEASRRNLRAKAKDQVNVHTSLLKTTKQGFLLTFK
jgi:hypothetical protein